MLRKIKSSVKRWQANRQLASLARADGQKTLTMCKKCYSFYYGNSWHFERPDYLQENSEQEFPVRFVECHACLEMELASYETEQFRFA